MWPVLCSYIKDDLLKKNAIVSNTCICSCTYDVFELYEDECHRQTRIGQDVLAMGI